MLEAYEAYGDYDTMADLTRTDGHRGGACGGPNGRTCRDGTTIDLEQPWRRATLLELISAAVDEPVGIDTDAESLRRIAVAHEVALRPSWDTAEILVELYEQLVEQTLVQPTFVCDYPAAVKPLAKQHRTDPGLVEAWDLVINGVELAPAYSEMNDRSSRGRGWNNRQRWRPRATLKPTMWTRCFCVPSSTGCRRPVAWEWVSTARDAPHGGGHSRVDPFSSAPSRGLTAGSATPL
jgi:lysyl-tRNA synthetase class II